MEFVFELVCSFYCLQLLDFCIANSLIYADDDSLVFIGFDPLSFRSYIRVWICQWITSATWWCLNVWDWFWLLQITWTTRFRIYVLTTALNWFRDLWYLTLSISYIFDCLHMNFLVATAETTASTCHCIWSALMNFVVSCSLGCAVAMSCSWAFESVLYRFTCDVLVVKALVVAVCHCFSC